MSLITARARCGPAAFRATRLQCRTMTSQAQLAGKEEGDISSVFVSLSGATREPLPTRFRDLKYSLVAGKEDKVIASWNRLLKALAVENDLISTWKSAIIPSIEFNNLEFEIEKYKPEIQKRGAAVIRGVVPEAEARLYKFEIEEYVKKNPHTKAFPAHDPQVYELYWSEPQLKARAHPNLLATQRTLMQALWHSSSPDAKISLSEPLTYADRLRIRQPGDATFALGPHIDGGSVERWERNGYGLGGVYDRIFDGEWEKYDPWDAATRIEAVSDLYNGAGACSMFRMFQGWLSMSVCGPLQGTLLVNPAVKLSTAYMLLRPFFQPVREGLSSEAFLAPGNWAFTGGEHMTSELQGATPSHAQELNDVLHPHLELSRTMVHMPEVRPGDFVVWHCDTIHAVDKVHSGKSDSSVLYIPVCPTTEINAKYLVRQREAFINGTPGPDFPGGKGESDHVDRPGPSFISEKSGRRAMGLERLSGARDRSLPGARAVVEQANSILGF
ncbi:hypothetical protein jhhlp_002934 [Lomentospora prolificans]|uniref:DUF1479 domain protein n=1 Tax=Lomentospora prolificans TaxID=41688 RepID=A0A2N3NFG5_9PEZI|nr:hypothetical protein jhhlp_002934 [Lomentospora prolificans]